MVYYLIDRFLKNLKLIYKGGSSMINNLPMEVFSPVSLEECWIFENRHYRYYSKRHLHYSLPTVSLEYEATLKENGTPYRIKDDCCEYWNPEHFEEKSVTAPLYVKFNDVYRYTKSYTGTVPTTESIEAANQTKEVVDYTIKHMKLYQKIKSILPEGEYAKAFDSYAEDDLELSETTELTFNGESFLILPIKRFVPLHNNVWYLDGKNAPMGFIKTYIGWNIIIDMNTIKRFSTLEITVPKGKKGLFIGESGWQVKEISKQLKYRRINFVEEA